MHAAAELDCAVRSSMRRCLMFVRQSLLPVLAAWSFGCFSPNATTETQSGATASSDASSTSDFSGATTSGVDAVTSGPGTGSTSDPDASSTSGTSSAGTGSSSGSPGSTSSGGEQGSSSTGPQTIDPEGPYGDCAPLSSCPAGNSDLGCATTDTGQVCLPDCAEIACPESGGPTPAFCLPLVGGREACLVLCQEDGHCPPGLTCQDGFSSESICAWS